jgi:hypothetical protein
MLSHQSRSRTRRWVRPILSLLVVLALVFTAVSQVRRDIQISKFVNPSRVAGVYFKKSFRFGGGVVPRGSARFWSPTNGPLGAKQLELVILDKAKLGNGRPDYDAIGIRWQGEVYQLGTQDDLIYALMKFVQRESYIAYTVPVAGFDEDYFKASQLVPFRNVRFPGRTLMGYVAIEFKSPRHGEFVESVDFARARKMPAANKQKIIQDINTRVKGSGKQIAGYGTYVNADFHVTYQVYLTTDRGRRVVDVGGLPLRYHFSVASDDTAIIRNVEVFSFPQDQFGLQDRAVMFFQTAALLRQFNQDNKPAFNRFLNEVAAAVRKR